MKKKRINKSQALDMAYKGMIPWSREEFNWVNDTFKKRFKILKNGRDLDAEYGEFKEGMFKAMGRQPKKFDNTILLGEIFLERYPDQVEYTAHFVRHHLIINFLDKYMNELVKEGFWDLKGHDAGIKLQLIDSLCTLVYSLEQIDGSGDKSHTFLYPEVIDATWAKINAHLN